MTCSKKTLYIVQKLDAIHGAIKNIKQQECETETATQLSITLIKHLKAERERLIHKLESIANTKSVRAAGKAGLPTQNRPARRHYPYENRPAQPSTSQIVLH